MMLHKSVEKLNEMVGTGALFKTRKLLLPLM
jgi:hypothetical protein